MSALLAALHGFGASASLIVAIGAQNAFVMRQGLRRQHLLATALLCSTIDALLIGAGAWGMGRCVAAFPLCLTASRLLATLFLVCYGAFALRAALRPNHTLEGSDAGAMSLKKTCLLLLAFSLLNPHVYLDTVLLLGSIAAQYQAEKMAFATGAIGASFAWFFGLTYGVRLLAPLLRHPYAWQLIDGTIALTMWAIAIALWR